MLKEIKEGLRFSRSEIRVIVFMAAVIVAGYVIRNFRNFIDDAGKPFDYTGMDSQFVSRSLGTTSKHSLDASEEGNRTDPTELSRAIDSAGRTFQESSPENEAYGSIVDLNTAGATELEGLPGIGGATALRIIEYREKNGKFRNATDLMKVKGIGKKKFEKLRHLIKAE
ncbi:MAG: helix-hairpin-helix domain-containing protein [Ignavibacteria bacterium]|nr:helix-hairpin-helix domain-containing protein [Ignavibacteria bacterium]